MKVDVYKFSQNLPENHPTHISTDNIDPPCDVQFKRSWMEKKSAAILKWFPHWATERTHSQHQREGGLSCLAWWAQSLVMAWSISKASGLKAAWKQTVSQAPDRNREFRPAPHQTGVSPSWHEWHPGLPQKTALQTDESHQKLLFFWSEKTSRSSPWHYFLYLSFFPVIAHATF